MNRTPSTTTTDGYDSFRLYLLLEATSPELEDTVLDVAQKSLKLTRIHEPNPAPEYTCISYVWGVEKMVNPFKCGAALLSPHTLPALTSAMRNFDTPGFWIDAFCVPPRWPEKGATLESMAYIYHHAARVAVILSTEAYGAIRTILDGTGDMVPAMQHFERCPWIRSVWTYQEVINNYNLYFISCDPCDRPIHGINVLNEVCNRINQFRMASKLHLSEAFPNLMAFEDLLLDWKVAYYEPSALQVMVGMQGREYVDPANLWYAMIGAITSKRVARPTNPTIEQLAERFMGICEQRGDFSFLFATVERDEMRRWRPKANNMLPVLRMGGSFGILEGHYNDNERLVLRGMIKYSVQHATPGIEFYEWVEDWRQVQGSGISIPEDHKENLDAFVQVLYRLLVKYGFTGTHECIAVEDGLFFSQWPMPTGSEATVLVPTTIQYRMGAPALVVLGEGDWYAPGVFVGPAKKQGEEVVLK